MRERELDLWVGFSFICKLKLWFRCNRGDGDYSRDDDGGVGVRGELGGGRRRSGSWQPRPPLQPPSQPQKLAAVGAISGAGCDIGGAQRFGAVGGVVVVGVAVNEGCVVGAAVETGAGVVEGSSVGLSRFGLWCKLNAAD